METFTETTYSMSKTIWSFAIPFFPKFHISLSKTFLKDAKADELRKEMTILGFNKGHL